VSGRRGLGIASGTALALSLVLGVAGGPAATKPKVVTIKVTAKDFRFALSRRAVPAGTTVRFVVRNAGASPHDFVIGGKRTRVLTPRKTQTIIVRFPKKKRFAFLCSVPGHAKLGMKGVFSVGKAPLPPAPPPADEPPVDASEELELTPVGTFSRPVFVTSPPGDDDRVYVVEQRGVIRVLENGVLREQPLLDISDIVGLGNETGLLSLAFAPDFATSGKAYVFYNDRKGNRNVNVVEYRTFATDASRLDPESARELLYVVKPWENHTGGMLQVGPDGKLYISIGDGDSGVVFEPGHFAQPRDDLLGNILRIDPTQGSPYTVPLDNPFVGVDDVRPEIWAYGLRNPWRFWIDPVTEDMLIGDVGFGQREEIDRIPAGTSGQNFGWPCLEGTVAYDTSKTCEEPVPPLLDLPHAENRCSVIGGVVAHDERLPGLSGRYLYGDYCNGKLVALRLDADGSLGDAVDLGLVVPALSSFGLDGRGRVYVTSTAGSVYRIDPAGSSDAAPAPTAGADGP
jgi:glucose/arabinose dehydrogenase